MINIDKNKDIDGYVNKLLDIINTKIKLVRKISIKIKSIMCDINSISNMVNKNVDEASGMNNDDILNKFIKYLIKKFKKIKKRLKTVPVYQTNYHKILKDFYSKDIT